MALNIVFFCQLFFNVDHTVMQVLKLELLALFFCLAGFLFRNLELGD